MRRYMHVHMHIRADKRAKCIDMCMHMRVCAYTCMHACMHTHTCMQYVQVALHREAGNGGTRAGSLEMGGGRAQQRRHAGIKVTKTACENGGKTAGGGKGGAGVVPAEVGVKVQKEVGGERKARELDAFEKVILAHGGRAGGGMGGGLERKGGGRWVEPVTDDEGRGEGPKKSGNDPGAMTRGELETEVCV